MPTAIELSVQLYSLRHMPDLDRQLRLVRDCGLSLVELTSANLDDVGATRRLLDRYGLETPSAHLGIDRLRHRSAETVAAAAELGIGLLVLWGLPEAEQGTDAVSWTAIGRELAGHAGRLRQQGLDLAFHNHDWELGTMPDGRSGLDHLFAAAPLADGAGLLWQADLAWLARGGADVPAVLATHAGRLCSVHLKDLAPAGEATDEDGWADLGHGVLPWPDWSARLRAMGVRRMVLEHDEPGDPARFLGRSVRAARELFDHAG